MRRSAWLPLAALLAFGCEKPPPSDTIVIPLGDPRTAPVTDPELPPPDDDVRSWATAPWTGHPWLAYPGRGVLQIQHDLGRVPQGVIVYISFTDDGESPAVAPGDLAQLRQVDADHVTIWNNTNTAYFARVVVF